MVCCDGDHGEKHFLGLRLKTLLYINFNHLKYENFIKIQLDYSHIKNSQLSKAKTIFNFHDTRFFCASSHSTF